MVASVLILEHQVHKMHYLLFLYEIGGSEVIEPNVLIQQSILSAINRSMELATNVIHSVYEITSVDPLILILSIA